MSFEQLVEVKNVYPGIFGGCEFTATYEGITNAIWFRVKHSLIARNPNKGEFWLIKGDTPRQEKHKATANTFLKGTHRTVVIVRDATISALPDINYLEKFLGVHPRFRGFNFGPRGAFELVDGIGAPELVKLLNQGAWKIIAEAKGRTTEYQCQRICDEWLGLKDETELTSFLVEHNLPSELAKKIVKLCRYNIVERLKNNPFSMVALSNSKPNTLNLIATVAKNLNITPDDDRALIGVLRPFQRKVQCSSKDHDTHSLQRCGT